MKILYTLLVGLFMTSCALLNGQDTTPLLFNPNVFTDRLEVSVMSNGCTNTDNFYLIVSEDQVTLRQPKPDLCRAMPSLIRLSFNYDFGGKVYQFKNKVRYMNRVQVR